MGGTTASRHVRMAVRGTEGVWTSGRSTAHALGCADIQQALFWTARSEGLFGPGSTEEVEMLTSC